MKKKGFIALFSSPSGAGKTTIIKELLKRNKKITYSVSATTRPKRPGEIHGRDYYFLSPEEFKRKLDMGKFVEWTEIQGFMYGTPRENLTNISDKTVILDLDTKGAMQVKKNFPDSVMIFIAPPSIEVLKQRLKKRGTDSKETINYRLQKLPEETKKIPFYDYLIINENLETAVKEAESILEAESCRTWRVEHELHFLKK